MPLLVAILLGLAMGAVFGVALEKSRVFEPAVILGQMQLRNFLMLKVFLSAVATGLVVLATLNGLGWTGLHPKATFYAADLLGGLLLGVGIALAGACPGTVFAQLGAGYRDAWFTLAGGLVGALAFTYAEPALHPLVSDGPGKLTLDVVLGVPFWPLAVGVAVVLMLGLAALERWRPWRDEIGRDADGVLPGPGAGDVVVTAPSFPAGKRALRP